MQCIIEIELKISTNKLHESKVQFDAQNIECKFIIAKTGAHNKGVDNFICRCVHTYRLYTHSFGYFYCYIIYLPLQIPFSTNPYLTYLISF